MQKRDQYVYYLTVEEASEAFAEYLAKRTGEKFGTVSGVSIGIDSEKKVVIWTITPVHKEKPIISSQRSELLN